MPARYVIEERADGWAVIDRRTALTVVLGAQVQTGLSGAAARATADRLNSFGSAEAMSPADIEELLRTRPRTRGTD